jgi:hypothetical protein
MDVVDGRFGKLVSIAQALLFLSHVFANSPLHINSDLISFQQIPFCTN